jgi:hypothetical protein
MIDVFLSASIPLPTRNRVFFETADVLLIREAVKALVEVVLPTGRITFGGHPAITPMIALFVRDAGLDSDRLTIFRSQFFAREYPPDNQGFVDVRLIPAVSENREASLFAMREAMLSSRRFAAAVLIGGMEGIFDELTIFHRLHPAAVVLPLASTGAAAAIVHKEGNFDPTLASDLTYASLFRRRLPSLSDPTGSGQT